MKYVLILMLVSSLSIAACGSSPESLPPVDVPAAPLPDPVTPPVHCDFLLNRTGTTTPKANYVPSPVTFKGDVSANVNSVSFGEEADPTKPFASLVGTPAESALENFAMRCSFTYLVKNPGNHKFTLTSDDGSALYIDQKALVTNNDGPHGMQTKIVTLAFKTEEVGPHTVVVLYAQGNGPKGLNLTVQEPAPPVVTPAPSSL